MRTFLLAPDSFKGSASAKEVCEAMEKGIHRVLPQAHCMAVPMADGGEGSMQTLVDATSGSIVEVDVLDPLGHKITASYGVLGNKNIAIIEMATASGLCLIPSEQRNPLLTTTYGTGQLLRKCLDDGFRHILIAIGGSATNEGGAGLFQALGGSLLDKKGHELAFGGANLIQLDRIDVSKLDNRLQECIVEVACDVTNPLCGENGASAIFGPQKGATPAMVTQLDKALQHYANEILKQLGKDIADIPGAGAAGGLGAGLLAFTPAKLTSGIDMMIHYTGLKDKIQQADLVFTGEGKIDYQTPLGKTVWGVAKLAKAYHKPVIALSANMDKNISELYTYIDAIFSIVPGIVSMEESIKHTKDNISRTMENIIRCMNLG